MLRASLRSERPPAASRSAGRSAGAALVARDLRAPRSGCSSSSSAARPARVPRPGARRAAHRPRRGVPRRARRGRTGTVVDLGQRRRRPRAGAGAGPTRPPPGAARRRAKRCRFLEAPSRRSALDGRGAWRVGPRSSAGRRCGAPPAAVVARSFGVPATTAECASPAPAGRRPAGRERAAAAGRSRAAGRPTGSAELGLDAGGAGRATARPCRCSSSATPARTPTPGATASPPSGRCSDGWRCSTWNTPAPEASGSRGREFHVEHRRAVLAPSRSHRAGCTGDRVAGRSRLARPGHLPAAPGRRRRPPTPRNRPIRGRPRRTRTRSAATPPRGADGRSEPPPSRDEELEAFSTPPPPRPTRARASAGAWPAAGPRGPPGRSTAPTASDPDAARRRRSTCRSRGARPRPSPERPARSSAGRPTDEASVAVRPAAPPGHGRRQPEGRRRQDHDRGEPRRLPGRPRLPGAGGRPRPPGQRQHRPRHQHPGPPRLDVRRDPPRPPDRGLRRGHLGAEPVLRAVQPRPRRRRDRAGAGLQPGAPPPEGARARCATTTTSCSSTARRRSACSR